MSVLPIPYTCTEFKHQHQQHQEARLLEKASGLFETRNARLFNSSIWCAIPGMLRNQSYATTLETDNLFMDEVTGTTKRQDFPSRHTVSFILPTHDICLLRNDSTQFFPEGRRNRTR